jgi:alpha-1,2-rhamnosyltransferase
MCAEIQDRIEDHPRFGTNLFWYADADDTEIQYMYRRARAVLTASHAEGYGLPIIEALYQRTPVLASDIDIHREVGGDKISYFSLADENDLAHQLLQLAASPNLTRPHSQRLVPTWLECTRNLLRDVLNVARATGTAGDLSSANTPSSPERDHEERAA